jgi:hypothetical protein
MLIHRTPLLIAALLAVTSAASADPTSAPRSSPGPSCGRTSSSCATRSRRRIPGLYRFTPKANMDRIFDAAEKRIDRPMDGWEFYRLTAPVVASIHCGHTRIEIPETLQTELNTTRRLLPMVVRVLGGRAFVYRDLSNAAGVMAGRELLAVNGVQTRLILDSLYAVIPSDGFGRTLQPRSIDNFRFAGLLERVYGLRRRVRRRHRRWRGWQAVDDPTRRARRFPSCKSSSPSATRTAPRATASSSCSTTAASRGSSCAASAARWTTRRSSTCARSFRTRSRRCKRTTRSR